MKPYIKYRLWHQLPYHVPSPHTTKPPMESVTETPVPTYHHHTTPLLPTDDISTLGSGSIFTDMIVLSSPQNQPRVIKCIKHPLDDRDAGYLSVNWRDQRLQDLRRILIEVGECRKAYWAQQSDDDQRFGRRKALAREHSIKAIGFAIEHQEDRKRREKSLKFPVLCAII